MNLHRPTALPNDNFEDTPPDYHAVLKKEDVDEECPPSYQEALGATHNTRQDL